MPIDYTTLTHIKRIYDQTERFIISHNLRTILKAHNIKVYQLSDILGISAQTAYAYTKDKGYTVKADLFNLIVLAAYLQIDTMEFFTPITATI